MTPIWTTELPYSLTGSMVPVLDAMTGSLLVSDGWGAPFASLSLRRLSLSDGEVTGAARVRSAVVSTALSPSPESILVASGKRLLELERATLREMRRWDKGVPQYAHHVVRIGELAVCMSSRGPTAGLFHLDDGSCRRKTVGSCQGLYRHDARSALICSGSEGVVAMLDAAEVTLTAIAAPGPFIHAAYADQAAVVLLGLGVPFDVTSQSVTHNRMSGRLAFVRAQPGAKVVAMDAPVPFSWLSLSPDGRRLVLADGQDVYVCTCDGTSVEVAARHELPAPLEVALVVHDRELLIAIDTTSKRGVVSAWRIGLQQSPSLSWLTSG
ncbi:hypothetical protein ACSRUE_10995 [Sorangium sp. KYC3313]|uniref:hypothetical protein n=1 Tax=Sorangium sp. KYC3313 TaxID=3449740 RepID=UPI003F88A4D0